MTVPKRILIIRLSALGDVAMASGLIPALRHAYPEARLAWLVEPMAADLLRHNPRLDEVIVWPKAQWQALWRARRWRELFAQTRRFIKALQERRFDLVLDAQGLLKSGVLARLSRARRRVGLGSREGSAWLMTEVIQLAQNPYAGQISAEYRLLANTLGADPTRFSLDVTVSAEDAAAVADLLAQHGLDNRRYAVICPFTTRPQKHWFEDRWRQLAGRLDRQLGLKVVMLGGPADRAAAERIAAGLPDLIDLAGKTTLGQAAAAIKNAALLIGVDTGLSHLGVAFGTPSLALFGSTRPYLDPTTARARVLYQPLPCSPCRRHPTCDGRFDCMRQHQPETVLGAARKLLDTAA